MDLYLFCVALGAAGLTVMTLLGFTGSHRRRPDHEPRGHLQPDNWKSNASSWLSPRVMLNVLVGFGATGLIFERLVGPFPALPIALVGGIAFKRLVIRPLFDALFRGDSMPARTLEPPIMSEARAVTGFDANGNGLISVELGGEVYQILGSLTASERDARVRVRAGDAVRIEEVDATRSRCVVSRINAS